VIAAGRLIPEKGFADLVVVARTVVGRLPGTGFLLVGDGDLWEDLEEAIQAQGLAGRFVLAGFRSDLDRLMASADLFVQSSHTEGLPNVVLEAACCSVPIVATGVGGTGEVVEDGRHGRLVPPRRPDLLASAVVEALRDAGKARRMATHARERVLSEFTFPAQAQAYRRLFDECLA
jgi:glycosyltransferase involved in cell wall biosynthesis